jgi:maleylacetate reductase
MNPEIGEFVYNANAARVVFGPGSVQHVLRELDRTGFVRALVLCTPQQRLLADAVAASLGSKAVAVFDQAQMHVPTDIVALGQQAVEEANADCCIAVGGGSTIGLAKALALNMGLPIIAIPTTYAGSEMTPIYGITDTHGKKTGSDPRVQPRVVIYDSELTIGLPVGMSVTSGINAIAHAAEGLYARDANPITSLMAEEGIRALSEALPKILSAPADLDARGAALYGAWLCGSVLGSVGMALHHKLCHTLGGSFGLPHAETHTVVLPYALAYNYRYVPEAMSRLERAMKCANGPAAIQDLASNCGAQTSLKEIGMKAQDLDKAADIAVQNAYWNPRPLEREAIRRLLQLAYEGQPPSLTV